MKPLITLAILAGFLWVPLFMQAMEIRQVTYTFDMEMAQDITCETFAVTKFPEDENAPADSCRIPAVHFQFNSAILSTKETDIILAGIEKCSITRHTPLTITGFTCDLGPDQFNQTLSLQRAKAVADLLRIHGLSVTTLQGKGSQNLISSDRQYLFKNRRVEIETCQRQQHVLSQTTE
jgi:outer membrane protein OmpA-like peptidoglycan-associated protein